MSTSTLVYLGLGSNLEEPLAQIKSGLVQIQERMVMSDFDVSRMVTTPPLGGMDQPDYFNCVCRFLTTLSPKACLTTMRSIEDEQGRLRKEHWGPRTLDIDLLLYGTQQIQTESLIVPHPGMEHRDFVLNPLLQLAPDLCNLEGTSYQNIYHELNQKNPSQLKVIDELD
jgi:2-amino-4-hydroxy-6-hydroxymethyldihydropteridine diphosphokinase